MCVSDCLSVVGTLSSFVGYAVPYSEVADGFFIYLGAFMANGLYCNRFYANIGKIEISLLSSSEMAKQRQIRKKKTKRNPQRWSWWLGGGLLSIILFGMIWYYRDGIRYYLGGIANVETKASKDQLRHDARNHFVMSKHNSYVFGIDVSQYQGVVQWDSVSTIGDGFPLDFIFIRATMGERDEDKRFAENWLHVGARNKLRGAYHYYRPNENSIKQAQNFIKNVTLGPGDLPPVLDIEERPRSQPMDSLRVGLRRWITLVEQHYGTKPILYSGDSYFSDFLEQEFSDYVLWIANYNFWVETPKDHWHFWQFTERGRARGIKGPVDINMFKGTLEDLENLCIPYL